MKLLQASWSENPLESQVSAGWWQQPRIPPACQPALKETRLHRSHQVRRIDCFCPVALLSLGCKLIIGLEQVFSACTRVHIGQLPCCAACQDILGDYSQHRHILPWVPCQLKRAHAAACQLQAPAGPVRQKRPPCPPSFLQAWTIALWGGGRDSAPATFGQQPTQPRHPTTAFMHFVLVHGRFHVSPWLSASFPTLLAPPSQRPPHITPPIPKQKETLPNQDLSLQTKAPQRLQRHQQP